MRHDAGTSCIEYSPFMGDSQEYEDVQPYSLVPRPSHPSVCRLQYTLVLQATNTGVRRPGNEASPRFGLPTVACSCTDSRVIIGDVIPSGVLSYAHRDGICGCVTTDVHDRRGRWEYVYTT